MSLVVPNDGEIILLRMMLQDTANTDTFLLRLYKNNYTPDQSAVLTSFTEADFTNYAQKTISRGDWATPSTSGGVAVSTVSQQSWTCGASTNTVYGYYVVDSASTTVLWAERFSVSRSLADGDVINLDPSFTLSSAS